jgi:hypothetical protein
LVCLHKQAKATVAKDRQKKKRICQSWLVWIPASIPHFPLKRIIITPNFQLKFRFLTLSVVQGIKDRLIPGRGRLIHNWGQMKIVLG